MSASPSKVGVAARPRKVFNFIAAVSEFAKDEGGDFSWMVLNPDAREELEDFFSYDAMINNRRKLAEILGGISSDEKFLIGYQTYFRLTKTCDAVMNSLKRLEESYGVGFDDRIFRETHKRYREALKSEAKRIRSGSSATSVLEGDEDLASIHQSCQLYLDLVDWINDGFVAAQKMEECGVSLEPIDKSFKTLMEGSSKLFLAALVFDEEMADGFRRILDNRQKVLEKIRIFHELNNGSAESSEAFIEAVHMTHDFDLEQMRFIKEILEKSGTLPEYSKLVERGIKKVEEDGIASLERVLRLRSTDYADKSFELSFMFLSALMQDSGLLPEGAKEVFSHPAHKRFTDLVLRGVMTGSITGQRELFSEVCSEFWGEVVRKFSSAVTYDAVDEFWLKLCSQKMAEASEARMRYLADDSSCVDKAVDGLAAKTYPRDDFFERSILGEVKCITMASGMMRGGAYAAVSAPSAGLAAAVNDRALQERKAQEVRKEKEERVQRRRERTVPTPAVSMPLEALPGAKPYDPSALPPFPVPSTTASR